MAYYPRRYYPDLPPTPRRPDYPPYDPEYSPDIRGYPPQPEEDKKKEDYVVNKRYKYYGIALCLLSVASLAVEIANVVYTFVHFKVNDSTNVSNAIALPYILTWIAPGIWGSIPVFITGILAIRVAGTNKKQVRVFALFCSLSAVVFTPAMIAVSVAEIIVYPASDLTYPSPLCYSLNDPKSFICLKFVLPLAVAIIGGIEFYLTLMVTIIFCCCYKKDRQEPNAAAKTPSSSLAGNQPADYPPNPQSYGPYSPYSPGIVRRRQEPYYRSLPPAGERQAPESADPETHVVLLPARGIPVPYPVPRPCTSRGFGTASAYNHGLTYGYPPEATSSSAFYGSIPSLAAFGTAGPNPAYRIVYN